VVLVRRHARHWLAHIASGGLVLAFLAAASSSAQQPYGKPSAENAADNQKPATTITTPGNPPSTKADKASCDESQSEKQTPECISWENTRATQAQAYWADRSYHVGLWGIGLIAATLFATMWAAFAGHRSAYWAGAAAKAAVDAVNLSFEALKHSQEVAERDLRPWLTVDAALDSRIGLNELDFGEGKKIAFFVRFRAKNVGSVAAQNVIYTVNAADFAELQSPDDWMENAIDTAVFLSESCLPHEGKPGFDLRRHNDSLAPSEEHSSRRWCPVKTSAPADKEHWKGYEFCVCVVAAYTGNNRKQVFYTAKVFPVGFPEVPTFQQFIGPNRLPIGTGNVAFGPVRKAQST